MKYEIEATIPTTQYGNIRPKVTIDNPEEEGQALSIIEGLWKKYGENQLRKNETLQSSEESRGVQETSFTGETVIYDDHNHKYYTLDGEPLLSGSKYADQFAKPFDKDRIIGPFAEKNGWDVAKVEDMWRMGNTISTSYGTALHECVEMLVRHGDTDYVDKYVPPLLQPAIEEIMKHIPDNALTEVLVTDVKNKRAGRVDILQVDGKKFSIIDIKTNREMKKAKKDVYARQLSFYADTLIQAGYELDKLKLVHFADGTAEVIELDYINTLE